MIRLRLSLILLIASMAFSSPALADTIDYWNLGTFQAATIVQQGVTVSGSANVNVLQNGGLGIVGGSVGAPLSDFVVDTDEFIEFTFTQAGSATDILYSIQGVGDTNSNSMQGERILEAFGIGGTSLGTVNQVGFQTEVSSLFGNVPISRFRLTSPGVDIFRVYTLTFTPASAPIPEPSTLLLFGTGVAGLMGNAWRRKRQDASQA